MVYLNESILSGLDQTQLENIKIIKNSLIEKEYNTLKTDLLKCMDKSLNDP